MRCCWEVARRTRSPWWPGSAAIWSSGASTLAIGFAAAAEIVGGRGGGKPDMAQAGGKHPEKLPEALQTAQDRGHLAGQLAAAFQSRGRRPRSILPDPPGFPRRTDLAGRRRAGYDPPLKFAAPAARAKLQHVGTCPLAPCSNSWESDPMRVAAIARSLCLGLLVLAGCSQNPYMLQSQNKTLQQQQATLEQRIKSCRPGRRRSIAITKSWKRCWPRPGSNIAWSTINWPPCGSNCPTPRRNWPSCAIRSRSPTSKSNQ